jgi:hypothetical protein
LAGGSQEVDSHNEMNDGFDVLSVIDRCAGDDRAAGSAQ